MPGEATFHREFSTADFACVATHAEMDVLNVRGEDMLLGEKLVAQLAWERLFLRVDPFVVLEFGLGAKEAVTNIAVEPFGLKVCVAVKG